MYISIIYFFEDNIVMFLIRKELNWRIIERLFFLKYWFVLKGLFVYLKFDIFYFLKLFYGFKILDYIYIYIFFRLYI